MSAPSETSFDDLSTERDEYSTPPTSINEHVCLRPRKYANALLAD